MADDITRLRRRVELAQATLAGAIDSLASTVQILNETRGHLARLEAATAETPPAAVPGGE